MGGGGETRAPICRAAGWPGRACTGWEAHRETRCDGRGRCTAEEGDDQWVPLVSGGERALCSGQADCGRAELSGESGLGRWRARVRESGPRASGWRRGLRRVVCWAERKERWAAGWAVVLGAGLGFPFLFLFPLSFSFPYSNSTQTISIRIRIQDLNSTTLCTQANKINAPA